MELAELDELALADQWTFVVGRIADSAVQLDAALKGLHAQLRGLDSVEALLSAPQNWTAAIDECRKMLAQSAIGDYQVREAINVSLDVAVAAYKERNRYMHDLLTADVADELVPEQTAIKRAGDRYRVRLTRKAGEPGVTAVSIRQAREAVLDLVAAQWRLRGARGYLAGQTTWRTLLLGHLEGEWDGTANWTYDGTDDDDDLDEEGMTVVRLGP